MTAGTIRARVRATARHYALDLLSAIEKPALQANLERPRVHLPYLHTVPEREEDAFRELLATLADTHTFLGYSEAVDRIRNGPIDRPYVSFSFDDGFKSNVRTARILEEFGARGMFFVPANFVGMKTRQEAVDFYGFTDGVEEGAMTWDDLQSLLADGHEVGNHTLDHQVVSWVDESEMHRQIDEGATLLRSRLSSDIQHFAWPRGRFHHFTDEGARTVFATGHSSCASAERGSHSVPAHGPKASVCLRRDHLMTSWPLRHDLYFLSRSSRVAERDHAHGWPEGWHVA